MTDNGLRATLERAIEGLVYSSESDRPFAFVRFDGTSVPVAQLTADEVAALADSLGADTTELSLDEFLTRHIERVDVLDVESQRLIPRYEELRDTLRRTLGHVRVFRMGVTEIRCVVLGNDPSTGELVGIETVAIET
ncbi:MAG TPA: nuclease A inhibitor family protein [Gemmatimonadaceae bacterium]|nr:nuclease A inhibitor family protein [Gemmatimonadaceae bacterium]